MTEPRPIYPKHFFHKPVPRENIGFILMPFAPEFEPVHEAIRAGIERAGLSPQRADDIFSTRSGMEKILRGIAEAEVVVADMSEQNANVFYEAGIAHLAKENVILLTRDEDDFPFDLQHIDHIVYKPTKAGLRKLTEKLQQVIAGLDREPAPEALPVAPGGGQHRSPAETRKEVLRLLRQCEHDWIRRVVPSQAKMFQEQFSPRLDAARSEVEGEALTAESIKAIQPAFLKPWQPIEEIGFHVIEQRNQECWTPLFQALERAYAFLKRDGVRDANPTVVGHSQLLALRTWTLWGAYALACENWPAVDILLHKQASFPLLRGGFTSTFPESSLTFIPNAAALPSGRCFESTSVKSLYDHTESFAERLFFNLEDMRGHIGFWLFSVDLMNLTGEGTLMNPGWVFAPSDRLERLLFQIENQEYARDFFRSVIHEDPQSVGMRWEAIRESLTADKRMRDGLVDYSSHLDPFLIPYNIGGYRS